MNNTLDHCNRCGRHFLTQDDSSAIPDRKQFATLQNKARLLDSMVRELRLYRGYCVQFDSSLSHSRLFAPLAAFDALYGEKSHHP